jgi:hypothetical protein
MQFAIAIPTDADSWKVVRRAEELGFSRAWFYDTQMLSADPFVAMAPMPPAVVETVAGYVELACKFTPQCAHYLENHRGHLMFVKPEERWFVTAELI